MNIAILILIFVFVSCKNHQDQVNNVGRGFYPTHTKNLELDTQTLELEYISWFCQCANWAVSSNIAKYQDSGRLSANSIFIEPADSSLNLPDTLGYSGDIVRFTGQFYKEKGYPKNYPITEMQVDSAKVFHYIKFQILSSGYRNFVPDSSKRIK